jgi:2-methylcitrate dehydratase PrpD
MAHNTEVRAQHDAPPITATLARFVAEHPSRGWSDAVEHEAHRTWLNWVGCAVGAAHHAACNATVAASRMLQPAPQAAVLGRKDRLDMASAALANGISSHTFDFDDTHLKTIIHPAGPVASALLALAEVQGSSGREVIDALVLGIDVACRVGNMIYPQHYDRGWHITGTTGMLGAAAGCARLLKLDARGVQMALGIAASQPIGLREQFGTMSKPFHPGGAARAGLTSALLAKHGFTASPRALEAPRGFAQVISDKQAWHEITDELGERFEISFNTYKPFACGIVVHPAIDAACRLRAMGVKPEQIERIELRVHSLVLELCGKKTPTDGLQAKFSVYHGVACGLMVGKAGEGEYDDDFVMRPDMVALRARVQAVHDPSVSEDQVRMCAVLKDGRQVDIAVDEAIGSLKNPLSDAALQAKARDLAEPVIGAQATERLMQACLGMGRALDMSALVEAATPR